MGIFDFFRREKAPENIDPEIYADAGNAFSAVLNDIRRMQRQHRYVPVKTFGSLRALAGEPPDFRRAFLLYAANYADTEHDTWHRLMEVINHVLSLPFDLDGEHLLHVVTGIAEGIGKNPSSSYNSSIPYDRLLDRIEEALKKAGPTPAITQALTSLQRINDACSFSSDQHPRHRILFLMQGRPELRISVHDHLGKELHHFMQLHEGSAAYAAWVRLIALCETAGDKTLPTKKWLQEAERLLGEIDHQFFATKLAEWLQVAKEILRAIHNGDHGRFDFLRDGNRSDFLQEVNHNVLKGLIWCAGLLNIPALSATLDDYAAWAYKKLPGTGPLSMKTGSACMFAFTMLPVQEAVARLSKFRNKIRNNTILKSIDKMIREVAEKHGYTNDQLMEIGVPDFGLDADGVLRMPMGEFTAVYRVQSAQESELVWEKEGKLQKSVPAAVKGAYGNALKQLKAVIKEIEGLLPVQKDRIEQSYLQQRTWKYKEWKANYVDHPLVGIIARRLIWHFSNGAQKGEGIYADGRFVNVRNEVLDWLHDDTDVQLWHPIGFAVEEISAWRSYLQEHQVVQPFKQAHREIYIITDAELNTNTYSNRFAAHIVRQHQFAALCRARGWYYQLMGQWDSHNTPYVLLPKWKIRAEFFVDAPWEGEASDAGIFMHITTDQVRFHGEETQLALADVPALVFTEVMRDIDLFVGVCSIGNDPAWTPTGDQRDAYWNTYSFGDLNESGKVRSDVIKNLVPRLKIKDQCSFEGKFLVVRGKLRTYKIHMGSGNILMEPNDQYLCIVPDRGIGADQPKLFLPFEGDQLLSVIISKALLLAADDKIKDPTITRQILQK